MECLHKDPSPIFSLSLLCGISYFPFLQGQMRGVGMGERTGRSGRLTLGESKSEGQARATIRHIYLISSTIVPKV